MDRSSFHPDREPDPLGAQPIVLFDGTCGLCDRSVRWILRHDRAGVFRFAALQSEAARRELAAAGVDRSGLPDSMILIDDRTVLTRSDAAIAIAAHLGPPWSLARAVRLIPRGLRDGLYSAVARRRVRWFGSKDLCQIGPPDWRGRFLDADEWPAAKGD